MSYDLSELFKQQLGAVAGLGLAAIGAGLLFSLLESAQEDEEPEVELIPPEDVPKYQFKLDRAKIVKMQKRHGQEE